MKPYMEKCPGCGLEYAGDAVFRANKDIAQLQASLEAAQLRYANLYKDRQKLLQHIQAAAVIALIAVIYFTFIMVLK